MPALTASASSPPTDQSAKRPGHQNRDPDSSAPICVPWSGRYSTPRCMWKTAQTLPCWANIGSARPKSTGCGADKTGQRGGIRRHDRRTAPAGRRGRTCPFTPLDFGRRRHFLRKPVPSSELALGHSACFEEYQELYRKGHPGITAVIREFAARLAETLCHVDELKTPRSSLWAGELAVWFDFSVPASQSGNGHPEDHRPCPGGASRCRRGIPRRGADLPRSVYEQKTVHNGWTDRQPGMTQAAYPTAMGGPTRP